MTNPKCKLVVVHEGWKVVPEEPTGEMINILRRISNRSVYIDSVYKAALMNVPQPDMPPVLRWEGNSLVCAGMFPIARINKWTEYAYTWATVHQASGAYSTEQEARRAAEKALGFPDGLVVGVVS